MSTPLLLHYNVDCLAPGGQLAVGLSSFVGPTWTGGIALLAVPADAAAPLLLQASVELRAGVPAVTCLPGVDEFTGRRVLASGSDDGAVELWYARHEFAEGQAMLERTQGQRLHSDGVLGVAAGPGGSGGPHLASASADGTLRLWDCGQLLACTGQLGGGGGGGVWNAVAWTRQPGTLASAGDAGRLCLWDVRQPGGGPAAAAAVGAPALCLSAAGQLQEPLVVGDLLGRVSLFDARSLAQPLQQRQLHGDAVRALAVDGARLASGGDDGAVHLLESADLSACCQLAPPRGDGGYVRALAWQAAPDQAQPRLYRGGWDQLVVGVPL